MLRKLFLGLVAVAALVFTLWYPPDIATAQIAPTPIPTTVPAIYSNQSYAYQYFTLTPPASYSCQYVYDNVNNFGECIGASNTVTSTVYSVAFGITYEGGSQLLSVDASGNVGTLGRVNAGTGYAIGSTNATGLYSSTNPVLWSDGTSIIAQPPLSSGYFAVKNQAGTTNILLMSNTGGLQGITSGTATLGYYPPVFNSSGASIASTTHIVSVPPFNVTTNGACTASTSCALTGNVITFSGASVYASTPSCQVSLAAAAEYVLPSVSSSTTGFTVYILNISSGTIGTGSNISVQVSCVGA